ncbi:MAG: hypothetical protein ACD_8C00044G0010 [uncultured bacterium]|nr:MAG: hypothetical protein ACD_8C00044G0010 [uncultured bacterium]
MNIFSIITIVLIVIAGLYGIGLFAVWLYEMKEVRVYNEMREKMRILENSRLTGAMLHVKKLKIQYDYHRIIVEIENYRQFIIENLLFLKKSTLKSE